MQGSLIRYKVRRQPYFYYKVPFTFTATSINVRFRRYFRQFHNFKVIYFSFAIQRLPVIVLKCLMRDVFRFLHVRRLDDRMLKSYKRLSNRVRLHFFKFMRLVYYTTSFFVNFAKKGLTFFLFFFFKRFLKRYVVKKKKRKHILDAINISLFLYNYNICIQACKRQIFFLSLTSALKMRIAHLLCFFRFITSKVLGSLNKRSPLQLKPNPIGTTELIGVNFLGRSFFNLYLHMFFFGCKKTFIFKRFFHFYSFFYLVFKLQLEDLFLSFLLSKFVVKAMFWGRKSTMEYLLFSVFQNVKLFVGVPISSLFLNSCMAVRLPLVRTTVFLAGRPAVVPTPSVFDKQFKVGLRVFVATLHKRHYIRDKLKRILTRGRVIGRRIPFYNRVIRLSALFVRSQSFFLVSTKKYQNLRFLKNEVFMNIKKSIYTFILQRTYMQYRWKK